MTFITAHCAMILSILAIIHVTAFLAQFPHPNGGTAYLFLDLPNLIATVITQWD